jgi:hypothetical protein
MTRHSGLTLVNVGVDTGVCEINQSSQLSLETGTARLGGKTDWAAAAPNNTFIGTTVWQMSSAFNLLMVMPSAPAGPVSRGVRAKRASGVKLTQSLLQKACLPMGQGDTWNNKEEFQRKNCSLALLQHLQKGSPLQPN